MARVIDILLRILNAIENKQTAKQKHCGIGYNGVK
jgi:hypothetical protein